VSSSPGIASGSAVARQWRQLSKQAFVVSQKTRSGRSSKASAPRLGSLARG
jgi:hypothetical protein